MRVIRPVFYGFMTLCVGLIAVAIGGFHALADVTGQTDVAALNRFGVVLALGLGFGIAFLGLVDALAPRRDRSDDDE